MVPQLLAAMLIASHPHPISTTVAPSFRIASAEQLLVAMRRRYTGRWYRSATFIQTTSETQSDGSVKEETWLEAMTFPGKLRIDFSQPGGEKGAIFARDSQFMIDSGKLSTIVARPHPLLLLGFDVYFLPPSQSMATLRQLGVDLSKLHTDVWRGRSVYVVGADSGDLHSRQFWVDRDRLLFVRMLQPGGRDSTRTSDIHFDDYRRLGGGWMAYEVEFLLDGKRRVLEKYRDVRANMRLDSALFDPAQWHSARHWHPARLR
ncbi:MAG: hypothetical protein ACR2OG_16635 [Gemmatimonadaceae bacterium]